MIFTLAALMAAPVTTSETMVGNWRVVCESETAASDGKVDRCRITTKQDGLEVAIVRDADGAQFTVKYNTCKPKAPVPPSVRSAEQLSGDNADKMMMGGVIEQIIVNCRESKHGPGALVIPMTEPDAHKILQATANLRPKVTNAQTH